MDLLPIKPRRRGSLSEDNYQEVYTSYDVINAAIDDALEISTSRHSTSTYSPGRCDTIPKVPFRRYDSEPVDFKPRPRPAKLTSSSSVLKPNATWPATNTSSTDSAAQEPSTSLMNQIHYTSPAFELTMNHVVEETEQQLVSPNKSFLSPKSQPKSMSSSDLSKHMFLLPYDTPPRPIQKQRQVFANQAW